VSIVNPQGAEVLVLRDEWLPRYIYGEEEYLKRVLELKRKRYYGEHAEDRAGILRYTKSTDAIFDLDDIPPPSNERELAWLLSFYWHVDQAYNSLTDLSEHLAEGERPSAPLLKALEQRYEAGLSQGLELSLGSQEMLQLLGIGDGG
jgi:hypothetical protein